MEQILAKVLNKFFIYCEDSDELMRFGEQIYLEKPIILTFNYDCILETLIEKASGERAEKLRQQVNNRDVDLDYSTYNWNRPLHYGIQFDIVELHGTGIGDEVGRSRFYNRPANVLSEWKILKLHGSLNWFRSLRLPLRLREDSRKKELDKIYLRNDYWWSELPDIVGEISEPLIITPVLYKEGYYEVKPFNEIWKMALDHLKQCKKLVIIGYSFARTDFSVRELFLNAFENNSLEELIIVNPDTSIVKIVKELTHFKRHVIVCENLNEYLEYKERKKKIQIK